MSRNRILLTGQPGVGKTTLTQKVYEVLKQKSIPVSGFYTTEIRTANGGREGFDVVTLNGNRKGVLARKNSSTKPGASADVKSRMPMVGQYSVDVASFERIAIPTLQETNGSILVIDEIGKMELFSKPFTALVRRLFDQHSGSILATIPVARGKPLQLVDEIRKRADVNIITVTKENRDELLEQIVSLLVD